MNASAFYSGLYKEVKIFFQVLLHTFFVDVKLVPLAKFISILKRMNG